MTSLESLLSTAHMKEACTDEIHNRRPSGFLWLREQYETLYYRQHTPSVKQKSRWGRPGDLSRKAIQLRARSSWKMGFSKGIMNISLASPKTSQHAARPVLPHQCTDYKE